MIDTGHETGGKMEWNAWMMNDPIVERVIVDLRRNSLVLELDQPLLDSTQTRGTVDVGALGRLIGAEIGALYLAVSDPIPGSELQGRSIDVGLEISPDRRKVMIPRRGVGWELSFPSGNQCWNRQDGNGGSRALCSIVATSVDED
jgi:hypothetical protein